MKAALQEADEAEQEEQERAGKRILDAKGRPILSEEEKAAKEEKARAKAAEKAKVREERIKKLVENLDRKLSIFTESATGPDDPDVTSSWKTICALEAECVVHRWISSPTDYRDEQAAEARVIRCGTAASHRLCVRLQSQASPRNESDVPRGRWMAAQRAGQIPCL